MMREIKFRAWSDKSESFEIIDNPYWFEENGVCTWDGAGFYDHFILEQYTGLKDKNGKEIYEGDILKGRPYSKNACKACGHVETEIAVNPVEWSDYDYNSDRSNNHGRWNFGDYQLTDSFDYEVIGNIHEAQA